MKKPRLLFTVLMTVMLLLAGTASATVITFDANGGEGTMSTQTITSTSNLSRGSFTKDGYAFVGWNTEADGSGNAYMNYSKFTATDDDAITLYAQWLPVSTVTPEEPSQDADGNYLVGTAAELYWIMSNVSTTSPKDVKLTADIVVNENLLTDDYLFNSSLTNIKLWTQPVLYKGTFDGQGHTISGIYQLGEHGGFIKMLYGGTIKNLEIRDSYFQASGNFGAAISYYINNGGTIENCSVSAYVVAPWRGGIAYSVDGTTGTNTIKNCYFTGKTSYGIAVNNYGTISNCYFDTTVTGQSTAVYYTNFTKGTTTNTEGKTSEAFASGEVAYLLNTGSNDYSWRQTLGTDAYPTLNSTGHLPVTLDNGVYSNSHTHNLTYVAMVASTCTTHGHSAYWVCSLCNGYFSDEEGNTEIEDKTSVVLPTDEKCTHQHQSR